MDVAFTWESNIEYGILKGTHYLSNQVTSRGAGMSSKPQFKCRHFIRNIQCINQNVKGAWPDLNGFCLYLWK